MAELKDYIAEAFKNVHATLQLTHGSEQRTLLDFRTTIAVFPQRQLAASLHLLKAQSKEDVDGFFTEFDRVASFYSWGEDKKAREPFHVPQLKGDTSRRFTSLDEPSKSS